MKKFLTAFISLWLAVMARPQGAVVSGHAATGGTVAASGGGGGSGTVTSVAETFTGGLISVAGSPITTSGTFALTVAGTSGGIPYFSGAATWATSAVLTSTALMTGGGAGAAPSTPSATTTLDGSGNLSTPGAITTGAGGSAAGFIGLGQGTAPTTGTTNIKIAAPAAVTSYIRLLPGAVGSTGLLLETVSGTTQTETLVTAIPNGFTATTQSAADNSTKVATTAYADAAVSGGVTASSTTTFTNKRLTARIGTTTSNATPTINTDNVDIYSLTAQAADITSFTTNLSGTPVNGDQLEIRITGTAARAITWGTGFVAGPVALPTTTTTTKTLYVYFEFDSVVTHWVCMFSGSLP